jgi:alpha-N-arabinofuranosidase
MYLPFQDSTLVPVSFEAGTYTHANILLPAVDAVAARDRSGRLWLALVNVDPNLPAVVTTSIQGLHTRSAAGQVLTAATVDATNAFDRPAQIVPRPFTGHMSADAFVFELPPKSVAVVEVR